MYEDTGGIVGTLPLTGAGAVALFGVSVPLGVVALACITLGAVFLLVARVASSDDRRRGLEA